MPPFERATRQSIACLAHILAFAGAAGAAGAAELTWWPDGTAGGSGIWDTATPVWWDGAALVPFGNGVDLSFPEPAGTVQVAGSFTAGTARFEAQDYLLMLDNRTGARLALQALAGRPLIGFRGEIGAGADSYPAIDTIRAAGLELRPSGTVRLEADLLSLEGGSPVLAVAGDAGRVDYAGRWLSDTGSIYSWLRLDQGGHLVLTAEADMRFIKEGYYTLQLWVTGDGSGTLELAPGFVADRTQGGTSRLGIGSIRIGAGTFISHRSASLPLGYRPQPSGPAQTNGHLVFENRDNSRWVVRSADQVYPGAVWIHRDMEVRTETDLMHAGVSEFSADYTARNGWSLLNSVTVTKTGAGALILAGEQSYAAGATLDVREGRLVMRSDPAAGTSLYGSVTGAQLALQVGDGAALEWSTDGALQSLLLEGDLLLNGHLRVANSGFALFAGGSTTELLLDDSGTGRITSTEPLFLDGVLAVRRAPGYLPAPGTEWIVCQAPEIIGEWRLDNSSGLDLRLVADASSVRLVADSPARDLPGAVWLEDTFDAPPGHWDDLSAVPLWGSPLAHGSAFEYADGVVRLNRSGSRSTIGYTGYALAGGLKTFTALDHRFERPVAHAGSEVTIDFRLRWPHVTDLSGEGGRVIIALNHSYPDGGLDLTPEGQPGSRVRDLGAAWWARPAYHVRLRNGTNRAGSSFLQYGGGMSADGEYEATDQWWLPGFISGAGGVAPGAGEDFPLNSWVRTREGMARDVFTTFRYRILPDRQELWRDDNDDGMLDAGELKAVMPLPASSGAPHYRYFPAFEGLRVFWNGNPESGADTGQMELDWLRVIVQENVSPAASAGPDQAAQVLVDGRAPVRLDASATTDPEGDALLFIWRLDGEVLALSRDPVAHVLLPPGEHRVELAVVDAAGNEAFATGFAVVTEGRIRPVARAGANQTIRAGNEWFGVAAVSAGDSTSSNGAIVRYRWSAGADSRILADGPAPVAALALPVGTHVLTLTVWDEPGEWAQDTVRIIVEPFTPPPPAEAIYRENFSRPAGGGEMGPWEVGWSLTRFDGAPVAPVKYDGNAHRSLNGDGGASYLPRINSNPTGAEADGVAGHMWMNQMPFLNASPGEWLLWTDEFAVDQDRWELAQLTFHAIDGSPERVKAAPAVRIDGQWYIGWDLRVETSGNYWRAYTLAIAATGWVLFEPSLFFSVRDATPVERLPEGLIDAFGVYFLKDYAWYVSRFDNYTLWARPRQPENPYGAWLSRAFPQALLTDPAQAAQWAPQADPDHDGWANIWEYALGGDPLTAGPATADRNIRWEAGRLVLDLPMNPAAANLTFTVHASDDLSSWRVHPASHRIVTGGPDGQTRHEWSIEVTDSQSPGMFFTWVPAFSAGGK